MSESTRLLAANSAVGEFTRPRHNNSTRRNPSPFIPIKEIFCNNITSALAMESASMCWGWRVVCVFVCVGSLPHTVKPPGSTRPYLMRIKQRIKTSPSHLSAQPRHNSWKLPKFGCWTTPSCTSNPVIDESKPPV